MIESNSPVLFQGRIRHRRRTEPEHSFTYRVWHSLIDVDKIPEICRRISILSHNRFNILSLYDRDHMTAQAGTIRSKLDSWFASQGVAPPEGKVLLLTGLRHLGFGFNPVSFFFCYDARNLLQHVVAEVNNTFGETFCYLLESDGSDHLINQQSSKKFHVSPFQPVEGEYQFRITPPGDNLTIRIDLLRGGKRVFDATLTSHRRPLTDRSLLSAVARHAHLSALTVIRIHWQALKLWIKGASFYKKPIMPENAWRTNDG